MAKYDPLTRYLRRQAKAEVALTFHEIESLLNALLPKRARQAEWWANQAPADLKERQAVAWLSAGYRALPSIAREQVVFRKITMASEAAGAVGRSDQRLGAPD